MPSVSDGKALTGFSRRKVAVDELFLSEMSATGWLGGALNWKNSYSARVYDLVVVVKLAFNFDLPPAIAPNPFASNFSSAVFNKPRGHALRGFLVSGS